MKNETLNAIKGVYYAVALMGTLFATIHYTVWYKKALKAMTTK